LAEIAAGVMGTAATWVASTGSRAAAGRAARQTPCLVVGACERQARGLLGGALRCLACSASPSAKKKNCRLFGSLAVRRDLICVHARCALAHSPRPASFLTAAVASGNGISSTGEQSRAGRSHLQGGGSARHCSEMVHLWYKQGILYKGACGALAALVSRREGPPVGASGVGGSAGQGCHFQYTSPLTSDLGFGKKCYKLH
jgi:hypothetical protein